MILKGQQVKFKKEWQDAGDEEITFVAIENEDGGRVKVVALLGLTFNPISVVLTEWIQGE